MSTEKAAMRKAIRARYPGKSQRDAESVRLCAVIAQSNLFRCANVVAGYVPMAREADIMPLLRLTLDFGQNAAAAEGGRRAADDHAANLRFVSADSGRVRYS